MSGELIAASATGSAARAQHPHVTHAGGQLLSLLPAGSLAVQGSALTRLTKPEALNVSTATMTARANRRTTTSVALKRASAGIEAVVSLAQMGIVEIHTWNSTIADIERPNRIVWDLDPGPAVTWKQVVEAARLACAVLKTLGLSSWVKTTGGRGLHVVVPINPARQVPDCLEFSRAVSDAITRTDPQLYTTTFAKLGRERKILIDYLRNNRTNTSVCAYSPRARPGAVVSMPLDWSDLSASPDRWTLTTALRRLKRLRADPWAEYWTAAQEIADASFAAVQRL